MTDSPTTGTSTPKQTPAWLLPAVVCAVAVATGAGLLLVGGGGDAGSSTGPGDSTAASEVSDNGSGDASIGNDPAADMAPATAVTATVPTTSPEPGPGEVVIDGKLFASQYSCVHFPNSNPDAGIGDAHINTTLHQLVAVRASTSEPFVQVIAELQSFDEGQALRIDLMDGAAGQTEISGPLSEIGDVSVTLDGGKTVVVNGDLAGASNTCGNVLIQAIDDPFTFASHGYVAACSINDTSEWSSIGYMEGGNMMMRGGYFDGDAFVDVFRYLPAAGENVDVSDVSYDLNGGDAPVHRGTASPGPLSSNDSFAIGLFGFEGTEAVFFETPCTDAQLDGVRIRLG